MNNQIVNQIMQAMLGVLNNQQLGKLKQVLQKFIIEEDTSYNIDNDCLLKKFFDAKRTEGCSEKSLRYYQKTITKMLSTVNCHVTQIVTDDLRDYLTSYEQEHHSSKVTIDNIRRILSSFFNWLEDEDYIVKSPVRRIHKVRTTQTIKATYSDEELERLRDYCRTERDLAMVDLLASTGMRVGELVQLNIKDINFSERECLVLGKGNKERIVYFDARTKLHLQHYLNLRSDNVEAVFVSLKKPYQRLTIGGVESRLKKLGIWANVGRVHPHKFRRTLATTAIDKGMPIEQLQQLLGHKKIDTTLHYAMVKQQNVKIAHRKYIG